MSRARDRADGVLHNRTHEDTDGGRESIITFKGEQSGGEILLLLRSKRHMTVHRMTKKQT